METLRSGFAILKVGLVVLFLAMAAGAPAQYLAEQQAAMNVADTLSGASVGPTGSQYMNPAGFQPGAQPGYNPMMPNPAMPNPFGGMPGQPMAPVPTPAPPPIRQILVLTGERVECHVTGQLLEDIHYEYRLESDKSNFYDDGTHGNDLNADDNIWSNWTERNDVLSADANRLKLLYLRLLQICENTNPLEFFRIPVGSNEPLTPLPRVSDEEADRDKTFIEEWHKRFLSLYRVDPENPLSDFHPIFVPNPPRRPEIQAPPQDQYNAYAFALDSTIQNILDAQVAPPVQQQTAQTGGGGQGVRSSGSTGRRSSASSGGRGSASSGGQQQTVVGDRWGQLRQDARRLGANYGANYGTYQNSGYFAY